MDSRPKSAPLFNAPWPALFVCFGILLLYAVQSFSGRQTELFQAFSLIPILAWNGNWDRFFTYMLLHGSWLHAGLNAVMALAFATPVARAFGLKVLGIVSFFTFYVICGFVAGLGYALVKSADFVPMIGASGAVSGLMGAAMRLRERGFLLSLSHPSVIVVSIMWIGLNLATQLVSLMPGVAPGQVAWEAHVFGYICGLFLIWPWMFAFNRARFT
jgi:membrane associated rhomboid family serine protease